MRYLIIAIIIMFSVTANAEDPTNKVVCTKDSFTEKTSCKYLVGEIPNFNYSYLYKSSDDIYIMCFSNAPKDWELLHGTDDIYFKIDGKIYGRKMQLKTKVGVDSSYVVEKTLTLMDEKLLRLIVKAKEVKVRVGNCRDTEIDQRYRDGIKELMEK